MLIGAPSLALHLKSLEGNPGILPVKKGSAYLQKDHWTILKVLNLDQLYTDLINIDTNYQVLENLLNYNRSIPLEFLSLEKHVQYHRFITFEKYSQLVPQRLKRGLVDPLGSLIKIITGNLDHEDALKYDKLTTELNKNQIVISNRLTLITKIIDGLINNTDLVNTNIRQLEERLKIFETELRTQKNWIFGTYLMGLLNLFINNYRTIFIKLSEIETALALSKLSVLHQSIVNSTELLGHLQAISLYGNLLYTPTEMNLVKIEETIIVKSYIKKNQITFILEIPLIHNVTYNYYKIYSLPIYNEKINLTITIFPNYPFLMAKGTKTIPIVKPCRTLAAGEEFLCTDNDRALYAESTCLEQLITFKNISNCQQRSILIENPKVQQVDDENWILYSRTETTVLQNCKDDITRFSVFGTYMMTLNEPCEIVVDNIKIYHHSAYSMNAEIEPMPIVSLPQLHSDINTLSGAHALDIKDVNLDEIKYMSHALKNSELVHSVTSVTNVYSSSWFILTCVLMFIFIISAFIILRKYLLKFVCLQNYRKSRKNDKSDNFALEGGKVMLDARPSALD
ncbi:uncharacterized protein LOC123722550 [Papilio machaon]|uniref:uncharacterized protein LOC123722550 n=1 Tax=Papilio machaon TaxID=76193 RepID=UPI001E66355B|nr:uncharacterized protein LOC123722550 [Papilio machaon]